MSMEIVNPGKVGPLWQSTKILMRGPFVPFVVIGVVAALET